MANITNCTNYRTAEYIAVAAVNSALAGITFFACLFVIGLIFLFKKYLFFTQRLILYLCIATGLENLFVAVQASVYFPQTDAYRAYCIASGFLSLVTNWAKVFAYCCITCDLFLRAVLHKESSHMEWLYIFIIFIVPFLFNWIPFIELSFGEAGAWCWIRNQNEDCSEHQLGVILRLVTWYAPIYPILFITLVFYIIILVHVRHQVKLYEGTFDPVTQKRKELMAKEIRPLLAYPFLFLFFNLFALLNRLYETFSGETSIVLFWLQAIFHPLSGAVIALVYTLDPETQQRLCRSNLQGELVNCCSWKGKVEEYPIEIPPISDSFSSKNYSTGYKSSEIHM